MSSRSVAQACGFSTAVSLLEALKAILHGHPVGARFEPGSDSYELLSALYAHHERFVPYDPPEWFEVVDNSALFGFGRRSPGFAAGFNGGDLDRFSYKFDQWGKRDPERAARMAVYARHGAGGSGLELHHEPPWTFSAIVSAWKEALGREPAYAVVEVGTQFTPADEAAFLAFHDERAVLKPLPTAVHVMVHRKKPWLAGEEAVAAVRSILGQPGVAAIDFETYPTAVSWHADEAAARAVRGGKDEARKKAKLAAQMARRAKQRRACTLQLHHECGDEAFVRLDPGDDDAARADQLQRMFDGRAVTLCAHNAAFETEVLLKHGVAADVECSLLAAKALYLEAVPEDQPQPVRFGLADLVHREFGRQRDKTIRDRDWRAVESLDEQAVEYGLEDARDALALWRLYRARLEAEGLLAGYEVMARALLPTAATNLRGLTLDADAHAVLMREMAGQAKALEVDLDRLAAGQVDNHGSSQQVSTWILEQVLDVPIKPPVEPKLVGLTEFLLKAGGLRPDLGGELKNRDLGKLVSLAGKLSLEEATVDAWHAGYIGHEFSTFGDERPEQGELLAALDRERFERVLTVADDQVWRDYLAAKEHFDRLHKDDPYRLSHFVMRLQAKTGGAVKGWRTTKTSHLAITKGSKLRKAEQLAEAFPTVSQYLVKHAQWTKATKLLESFGPTLRRWQDDDGRVRSQSKVWAAWTGRQSAVDPNIQNQPREKSFRALWMAPPGRKLVIADYSQIELRLLAIVAGDERLREVYREGRDVHAETAAIAGIPRANAKNVNFAMAYGSGAAGLSENFGFSLDESRSILACVLGVYTGLAEYRERAPAEAAAQGYIAIRPGRRVHYGPDSPGTTGINAPIQGGGASVQMRAERLIHDALEARPDLDGFLCASVHDEFLVEAPDDDRAAEVGAIVVDCMVTALLEIFPEAEDMKMHHLTAASVVDSWAEKA